MIQIQTRPSAEGIVNSLYSQQQERAEDMIDQMAKNFWPMIGTANQLAFMAIDDAIEAMKEAGMWKHQEKVKAQKAVEEYHKYEHKAWLHFTEIDDDRYPLWQDLIGRASLKLEGDVTNLYSAIKDVLDKNRVEHADALAKIQVGVALTSLATLMYDTLEAQFQRQTVIDLHRVFGAGRITATCNNWKAVGELTGNRVLKDVNLRDDPACKLGIEVIMSRYETAAFLNEAAEEAIKCNPQIDYGV